MVFDDDMLLPGEQEDSAEGESKTCVLRIFIETDEGYEIDLVKYAPIENVIHHLYLPRLKRELYSKFAGHGPDNTPYYVFKLLNVSLPDYESYIKYDFVVDGGWVEERTTVPDNL
jgi:hypothetical protein